MNSDPLFFEGGAQRSYHPPALIDGQKPRLLTASEAAEWYPGEWDGSVYAWKIFPPKDYHHSEPRPCLCQLEELCGCGSAEWKQQEAAWFDRTIMQSKGPNGWVMNGTARELDLRNEWRFLSIATYDERRRVLKVEREKGPPSRLC